MVYFMLRESYLKDKKKKIQGLEAHPSAPPLPGPPNEEPKVTSFLPFTVGKRRLKEKAEGLSLSDLDFPVLCIFAPL